ncbi:20S proteasome subunit [Mycena galopus ATCC 62051]|nr:20S proteasome subunit [Mycena galopus ATCC 62051]
MPSEKAGIYVIIASDTTSARSIIKMKTDEDKIKTLSPHLLMAYSGEPGNTVQFTEYIRRALATSLRMRKVYSVNLLVGGYDTASHDPHLYWIDYFGTMTQVPFAAHSYGAYFALSLLDRYHDPEALLEEGLAMLRRCIDEVTKWLFIDPGKYEVKFVDKDGV